MKYKRNAKFYGLKFTQEFLSAHKVQTKIQNDISGIVYDMIRSGEISDIGLGLYVFDQDGTDETKCKFKNRINKNYNVFNVDGVLEKGVESVKRGIVSYVLERYRGYKNRNGAFPTSPIRFHGKSFYIKEPNVRMKDGEQKLIIPTLFGKLDLYYSRSLKEDLFRGRIKEGLSTGGNIIMDQKCFVSGVDVDFDLKYNPVSFIGFDLNKDVNDWICFSDGSKIPAPEHIKNQFEKIRDLNKQLDKDKKLPVVDRKYRSKDRRKIRREWQEAQRELRCFVNGVAEKIVNRVMLKKQCLLIDSVTTGQKMGTFGQDHLIPLLQTKCENLGIPFYVVPCKGTSATCSSCGHVHGYTKEEKKLYRPTTTEFKCQSCGAKIDAQYNGAVNVRDYGKEMYDAGVPFGSYPKRNRIKLMQKYSV